ncbi:MAG: ABC transporter permease [Paracoccaceae bacterium]
MFQPKINKTRVGSAVNIVELIYHATVRQLRKTHGNAIIGLLSNIFQSMIFVAVFYVMFSILGLRGSAVRGDFLLYIMSGIFLFMTHTKTMSAIVRAEGPTSAMMQHAPMNTIIAITSAALSTLYIQVLSIVVILALNYTLVAPFEIDQPVGAVIMFMVAWLSGIAVGLVFLSVKPWFPGFIGIGSTIYMRANMIASGKMVLANTLPPKMLAMFSWNPLFHCIDQARGFAFINYNPHNSSALYPIYVSLALIMIGLLGEFYTRKHASVSWDAAR